MARRIHLAAPGGGAACGAHNLGKRAYESEVLASNVLALVDCRKCQYTSQWKEAINPTQYKLRLFTAVGGKRVINPVVRDLFDDKDKVA